MPAGCTGSGAAVVADSFSGVSVVDAFFLTTCAKGGESNGWLETKH